MNNSIIGIIDLYEYWVNRDYRNRVIEIELYE
ncbi:hypothetical protein MBBAR_6c02660 [Methanobrevibacter arboriphilus JCM 13429 = DSM 1125]|uniref:Uncharacterized protein n=1 Tax=Methanobrevibacter arboriphilus JCM 13429 = DSM 1125 TaxID=1300164 RepID=A0A1V6N3C0_METAZ|nr:hypothetical protein MBBAR_6c02660 [Methanobrevibacter arboriphilus JCM 13429 = DSM 1125]